MDAGFSRGGLLSLDLFLVLDLERPLDRDRLTDGERSFASLL